MSHDICLFQGGQTHKQSELLQETGAKKGCGRRGGAGGGNSPALATPDHCLAACVRGHLEKYIHPSGGVVRT